MTHTCKKCGLKFNKRQEYTRHINRLTDCVTGSKTNKKKIIMHSCKGCKKKFNRKDSLDRHSKICKGIKTKINVRDSKNTNINNNNGDNNNNIALIKSPVTINLLVFSKDGINSLTLKDFNKMLKSNKHPIEELITQVNFNPNKPEYHNIYYPDLKSAHGFVYEDNKWIAKKIDEILNTLLDAKTEDLNEILNDMGDFLNKKSRNKIKKAIEDTNYDSIPPGSRKKLMKYIKTILYNNKDMIIKTKKLNIQEEELINRYIYDINDDIPNKKIKKNINKKNK